MLRVTCETGQDHTNVLDPVSQDSVGDDNEVQLDDELALFFRIFVRVPLNVVPLLSGNRVVCHLGPGATKLRAAGEAGLYRLGRGRSFRGGLSQDFEIGRSSLPTRLYLSDIRTWPS